MPFPDCGPGSHFWHDEVSTFSPNHGPGDNETAPTSKNLDAGGSYNLHWEVSDFATFVGTTSFLTIAVTDDLGAVIFQYTHDETDPDWPVFDKPFSTPGSFNQPCHVKVAQAHNDVQDAAATTTFYIDPDGWVPPDCEEPPPPPPPPDGGDVIVIDEEGTQIGTIDDAMEFEFTVERQDTGIGAFTVSRASPHATEALLAQGNFFQVIIPRIDPDEPIWGFFSEPGLATIAATDEEGGEIITGGGRGPLSYLERAVEPQESLVGPPGIPVGGVITSSSTGNLPGQILNRFLEECLAPARPVHPVALLTKDFDYVNDSNGDPWATSDVNDELFGNVGDDGLTYVGRIMGSNVIDVVMYPDLSIRAFNEYGRDLTSPTFEVGKVRFEKGINIADQLDRATGGELPANWALISGDEDVYANADIATGKPTREVFVKTTGINATSLEAIGLAELNRRLDRNESIRFNVLIVKSGDEDEEQGYYLPGPPESANGKFWVGDYVTLHTGEEEWDIVERTVRIQALTIKVDEANNLECQVEVVAVFPNARRARVEGRTGRGGSGIDTGGGSGGSLPVTNPPIDSAATASILVNNHTADSSDAHNASAVSYSPTAPLTSINVQDVIEELMARIADLEADLAAHDHPEYLTED
jgi:hypothetical protein